MDVAPRCCLLLLLFALVASLATADARAEHCRGCMDGQPTEACPEPSRCGYQPILCVDCMSGMSMPQCPNATWCTSIDCSHMQCIDRQPTPTCPDPGVCGYQPLLCTGCVPGAFRFSCPRAEWCAYNQTTPPCMECMAGMAMPYCPNATVCQGAGPAPPPPLPPRPPPSPECEGCMAGMSMPHCPNPDLCGVPAAGDSCVMSVVFSASGRTCLLFSGWYVDSDAAQWLLAIVGIWLLAFLREGLTVYRTWAALVRRHEDVQRKAREADRAGLPLPPRTSPADPADPADVTSIALEPPSTFHSRAAQLRQPFMISGGPLSDDALHTDSGTSAQQPAQAASSSSTSSSSTSLQVWDSAHYLLSLAFGYLLMLLIMTYNVWVCLLVLAGCAFWHFVLHECLQNRWKPALMRRTQQRSRTQQQQHARHTMERDAWQQQGGDPDATDAAAAAIDAAERLDAPTAPVSGEHCCDDLVFDD